MVTSGWARRVEIVLSAICGKVLLRPLERGRARCFDGSAGQPPGPSTESREQSEGERVPSKQSRRPSKRAARKVSCEDCFFHATLLCALFLDELFSPSRPSEAELRPPQQLR